MGSSLFYFQGKALFSSRHASPVHKLIMANNNPVQAQDNQVAPTAILRSHPRDPSELWTWCTTEFDGNGLFVPEKEAMWSGTTCKVLGILSDKLYRVDCRVLLLLTSILLVLSGMWPIYFHSSFHRAIDKIPRAMTMSTIVSFPTQ